MRSKEILLSGATVLTGAALFWLYQTRIIRRPKRVHSPAVPEIDPTIMRTDVPTFGVYSGPVVSMSSWTVPKVPVSSQLPHESPVFGLDRERNEDDITVDDYLNMPLESAGITHTLKNQYLDLDDSEPVKPTVNRFSFFRFKILKTRETGAERVSIGGLRFLNGADVLYHPKAMVWNPHTGERSPYYPDSAWSATEHKELIVRFPVAIVMNGYAIRTSNESVDSDPVEWSLEGSVNGVYWFPLDEQVWEPPLERGVWTPFSLPESA